MTRSASRLQNPLSAIAAYLSMPTAPTRSSRRCTSQRFAQKAMSAGSRNLFPPTISSGLAFIRGRMRPPRWKSRPANMATIPIISGPCWRAGAVDVQQADVTRCGGYTGFLQVAALCEAHHIDLSGHCAPSLHLQVACAAPRFRHLEWFHDHVRIEHMLFDGAPSRATERFGRICRGRVRGSSSSSRTPSSFGLS